MVMSEGRSQCSGKVRRETFDVRVSHRVCLRPTSVSELVVVFVLVVVCTGCSHAVVSMLL